MTRTTPGLERLETRSLLTGSAPNPVIAWNAVALDAIRHDGTPPPVAARDLAILQIAAYDALHAVAPAIGRAIHVRAAAPHGTSPEAAVVGAAYQALNGLFPKQTALFDAALARSLASIPDTPSRTAGLTLGRTVALSELRWRADDGSATKGTPVSSDVPGLWRPTPPAFAASVLPAWGSVKPFALASGAQFRPAPPPALDSAAYAAAVSEVQAIGSKTSTTRTAEQTQIARFWADGAGTETPPGHWNAIAEDLASQHGDGLARSARTFALLDMALADAGIVCWDVKYADKLWRPVTAIREADTDGNPATTADPNWTPLLTTPAFPSYVSGHSTFSAAAATVLDAVYGRHAGFTTSSDALPGITRTFASFDAAAAEAGQSRVYGGIHFQFDNTEGLTLGARVGHYVLRHTLR